MRLKKHLFSWLQKHLTPCSPLNGNLSPTEVYKPKEPEKCDFQGRVFFFFVSLVLETERGALGICHLT